MKTFTPGAGFGAILAVLCGSPAMALPVFDAEAGFNGIPLETSTGDVVAGAQAIYPLDQYGNQGSATAEASASGLFATGYARMNSGSVDSRGIATATFDDFVISGPAGPVTTSFSMLLSGNLNVLTLPPAGERLMQASAAAIVEVAINGLIVTGDAFFQDRYRLYSVNGTLETQATGMLADWPQSGRITTPSFTVDAGVPFSLRIKLTAVGGANSFSVGPGLQAEGSSDMGGTLTFATGAVFGLPVGYSVNSPSAGIVDNQFVPEPASPVLLSVGASMLMLRSRRKRGPELVRDPPLPPPRPARRGGAAAPPGEGAGVAWSAPAGASSACRRPPAAGVPRAAAGLGVQPGASSALRRPAPPLEPREERDQSE